jgi:hypothetical protein
MVKVKLSPNLIRKMGLLHVDRVWVRLSALQTVAYKYLIHNKKQL